MERFFPQYLLVLSSGLTHIPTMWKHGTPNPAEIEVPDHIKTTDKDMFADVKDECLTLGLIAAAMTAEKLISLVTEKRCTYEEYNELLEELYGRIKDELNGQYFLSLSAAEANRFEEWGRGWEQILERFPAILRDVEEMNKCFALARYTASMFHALHVAEWGAIYLGDYIGVSDSKKGWAPTEKKLREIIKGGHPNLPIALQGNFTFLEQMHREIDSMILAWRHKVDHAANHLAIVPNTDFTPDIAEHVIGSVRIFMQRLLEGIPADHSGVA
jgi:hypothetical protein